MCNANLSVTSRPTTLMTMVRSLRKEMEPSLGSLLFAPPSGIILTFQKIHVQPSSHRCSHWYASTGALHVVSLKAWVWYREFQVKLRGWHVLLGNEDITPAFLPQAMPEACKMCEATSGRGSGQSKHTIDTICFFYPSNGQAISTEQILGLNELKLNKLASCPYGY